MKKLLLLITILLNLVCFSQDELGGTPVEGIIPIKRIESIEKDGNIKANQQKTNESTTLTPSSPTGSSEEVGVTEGQLSVSLTGGATYSIPIAVPPGINGIVPQIALNYNSQGGNGLAGYGWNISGVSVITRIPSTKFHDNTIDAVDFDNLDRFAFDGQRLIVKNETAGVYGANGTIYETEGYSNIQITSYGAHPSGPNFGPAYFVVQYPDGSIAHYGNSTNSRSLTDWAITYWQNPQGVRISYNYTLSNNSLSINTIKYGSRLTTTPINEISFVYKTRQRPEQAYIGNQIFLSSTILSEIKVKGNNIGFRNYLLSHEITSLGYERLKSITEKSGDNSKSFNPTIFNYDTTSENINFSPNATTINVNNVKSDNSATISGDFDGDGEMDFLLYPTTGSDAKKKYWLYSNINSNNLNIGYEHNIGSFQEIFPISWLGGGASLGYKLMPQQGWCAIQYDASSNITTFKNYSTGTVSPIYFQYEKTFEFPQLIYYSEHPRSCISPRPPIQHIQNIAKEYVNGDFNGDGLTDVLIIEKDTQYTYDGPCDLDGNLVSYTRNRTGNAYFLDLDRRLTNNYINIAGQLHITGLDKLVVADFNGDGKSDIFVFNTGVVRIYTLDDNNYLTLITTRNNPNISLTYPIYMGDYNGDGKADFITPTANNSSIFSKFLSTGTDVTLSMIDLGAASYYQGAYDGNTSVVQYIIPNDFNNDGKTDLIFAKSVYKTSGEVNNVSQNRFISVRYLHNKAENEFESVMFTTMIDVYGLNHFPIPVSLSFDKANANKQISFISNNNIYSAISLKDNLIDVLLKEVVLGNGVKEVISYQSLNYDPTSYENAFQPSSYTANYPNFDIEVANNFRVVSKLEQISATQYKKQKFKYYGAVTNVEGLGFVGFRGLARTNWFNDDNPVISSVSKHDITKRGAVSETYSVLGETYGNFTSNSPTSFINKINMTYVDELLANKVFKINNSVTISANGLEGTFKETTTTYDTYNNPLTTTAISKNGSTIESTEVVNIEYFPVVTSPTYIVGRLKKKNSSVTHNGDTMTGEEIYEYNSDHLVSKTQKKGHNTNYLTEENIYDVFGNITQKKISAIGLTPRITNFTYDTTGRFLTSNTDIEGLITSYTYNTSNGLLLTQTLPSILGYSLTTTYLYDLWGKKIKETDYLGKSLNYFYGWLSPGSSGFLATRVSGDDNSESFVWYDDLGRKIAEGLRTINDSNSSESANNWKTFELDIYDRVKKIYEPQLSGFPQWSGLFSTTTYDTYGRTTQVVEPTGKTTTINYSGLTTTTSDGVSNTASIKNSLGSIISMTDNGGTITYDYFANGNLKKSIINGLETIIEQDGWGRKTKLTDPSAGIYEYAYNDLGEMTMEITPNGQTNYKYDDFGKLKEKTITGLNTNSKETFTYNNTTKLLTNSKFEDFINDVVNIHAYGYDTYKRLNYKTEEISTSLLPLAYYQQDFNFDSFGRAEKQSYLMINLADSKNSFKEVKNTYKNGYHWQILDAVSNQVLWQTNEVNERGQLTSANYGNGLALNKSYDQYGYIQRSRVFTAVSPNTDVLNLYTTFEPQRGNLTSRTNSLFNWTENFEYDTLDRLTHYTNAQGIQVEQIYENDGRIKENTLGQYNYSNSDKRYQHTSIDINPSSKAYYQNRLGLFNDNMEQKLGWQIYEPSVFSFDSTVSHITGSSSLKIANTSATEKVVHSENWIAIDNAVPTEYTYSVWVKSDGTNPEAEIFLFMKTANETGYYTLVDSKIVNTSTDWVQIEKTFLVPASIKKLNIRLDNNATGVLWFDDVRIRKTSDAAPIERELNISYNTWKSPYEIEETGVDKISFIYNQMNKRSSMFYGGLQADKMERQYRKHYSADGSMEIKHNTATGEVEFITYIGGDGYSAPVVLKSDGTTQEYLYLHRDYLGSIIAITNQAGSVVEKRLFDAWGEVIKVVDGQDTILTGFAVLDRGYTGHEHLQSVALIHMNGRLYDAKLHRFLQSDNFVSDPHNTQAFNRYSYVLNNPLKYSDVSGELPVLVAAAIIGAFVGGASYVAHAIQTGNWSWGGFGIAVGVGAVVGVIAPQAIFSAGSIGELVISSFASGFMPAINIPINDHITLSASPSIAFGNAGGAGVSYGVTFSDGDFSISGGYGIMEYSNYNGFGANSREFRYSALVSYDDGKTGFSLGTNFWRGDFKQRTTYLGFRNGDFRFGYENDGSPFSYAGKVLSNNTDMYRTAAASVGIGGFDLQLNMFTGRSGNDTGKGRKNERNSEFVDLDNGRFKKDRRLGLWKNSEADAYRLGALSVGYKGYKVGVNSEYVRDVFQNWFAHKILSPQPGFRMLSNNWNGYFQYNTPMINKATLW